MMKTPLVIAVCLVAVTGSAPQALDRVMRISGLDDRAATMSGARSPLLLARNGADDRGGDDRGGQRGHRGGHDDGAHHG